PSASLSRDPRPSTRPPATMRPSCTPTSAVRAGAPVPSTTVPARITRSSILLLHRALADAVEPSAGLYRQAIRSPPTGRAAQHTTRPAPGPGRAMATFVTRDDNDGTDGGMRGVRGDVVAGSAVLPRVRSLG